MIRSRIEFLVGCFFILGIFCLFVLVFKVSNSYNVFVPGKNYKLKAIFKHIGNLKIKSKVTIYGVKVGYVNKISLVKNGFNEYQTEIEMVIDLNVNSIPKDSTASIFMVSLLGDNYVNISLGNDIDFLKNGDIINLTTQALILEDLIAKFAFSKQ